MVADFSQDTSLYDATCRTISWNKFLKKIVHHFGGYHLITFSSVARFLYFGCYISKVNHSITFMIRYHNHIHLTFFAVFISAFCFILWWFYILSSFSLFPKPWVLLLSFLVGQMISFLLWHTFMWHRYYPLQMWLRIGKICEYILCFYSQNFVITWKLDCLAW